MRFRVLGSLAIEANGQTHFLRGTRQRALLATLLISGRRPVAAEQLYTELWGEDTPSTVENAMHAQVYRLRQALKHISGPESAPRLITRAPGYILDIIPDALDINDFRRLIAESRAVRNTDLMKSLTLLEEALLLWRGEPLRDASTGPLCQSVASQMEEEYLTAVEDRLSLSIDCHNPQYVVGELRRMNAMHPWRERITELLMLALYRSGRQAEAVEVYDLTRRRLVNDLGMEPSLPLKQLFREILNQAPHLREPASLRREE